MEALPPEAIAEMLARGGVDAEVAHEFAGHTIKYVQLLQKYFHVTQIQAAQRAQELMVDATSLSPERRVQLAATLMAAYDYSTALLQWSYVPETTHATTRTIPVQARDWMNKTLSGPDEIQLLAIPLARAMHLQRLVAIDSQYDGVRMTQVAEKELEAIENDKKNLAYQEAANSPLYKNDDVRKNQANASGNLLPEYEYLNSPEYMQADIATQWDAWWRMQLPNGVDRLRYTMWEVRNHRIASNIADAAASLKLQRVLVIIGAAHKPFLDNYLGRLESVWLIQFSSLLGTDQ